MKVSLPEESDIGYNNKITSFEPLIDVHKKLLKNSEKDKE